MQDEFDLHLKWVPDERSRTVLIAFALKNNLALTEKENSLTLASPRYNMRYLLLVRLACGNWGINFNREHSQYLLFDMSKSIDNQFLDRNEWRRWLKEHHSILNEIWVSIYKKNSGRKGLKYEEAVEEAICFGWIDGKMQSVDDVRFRQRFSPRKGNSVWSKSNKERAERMIQTGKMTSSGFETISEAKRNGKWDIAYSSSLASPIPKDLEEALKKNDLSLRNFKSYSNSTKFQYIYWVNNAKKGETRRKRIASVVMKARAFNVQSR